jgi:hypothetical protein
MFRLSDCLLTLGLIVVSCPVAAQTNRPIRDPECTWIEEREWGWPSAKDVAKQLTTVSKLHDQYETQNDFNARIETALQKLPARRVWGGALIDQSLGYYSPETKTLNYTVSDLDSMLRRVDASPLSTYSSLKHQWLDRYFTFYAVRDGNAENVKRGVYRGQTLLGVTSNISFEEETQYEVGFKGNLGVSPFSAISINLDPELARRLRPWLRLVVAGQPSGEVLSQVDYKSPTLTDPTEIRLRHEVAVATQVCVAIKNSFTGETFATFKAAAN